MPGPGRPAQRDFGGPSTELHIWGAALSAAYVEERIARAFSPPLFLIDLAEDDDTEQMTDATRCVPCAGILRTHARSVSPDDPRRVPSRPPPGGGGFGHRKPNMLPMPVNIVGLGLLVAGVIFLIMGGVVGWILGVVCLIGGVGALFMTWQRRRRAAV